MGHLAGLSRVRRARYVLQHRMHYWTTLYIEVRNLNTFAKLFIKFAFEAATVLEFLVSRLNVAGDTWSFQKMWFRVVLRNKCMLLLLANTCAGGLGNCINADSYFYEYRIFTTFNNSATSILPMLELFLKVYTASTSKYEPILMLPRQKQFVAFTRRSSYTLHGSQFTMNKYLETKPFFRDQEKRSCNYNR